MARSPGAGYMLFVAVAALPLVPAIRDSFEGGHILYYGDDDVTVGEKVVDGGCTGPGCKVKCGDYYFDGRDYVKKDCYIKEKFDLSQVLPISWEGEFWRDIHLQGLGLHIQNFGTKVTGFGDIEGRGSLGANRGIKIGWAVEYIVPPAGTEKEKYRRLCWEDEKIRIDSGRDLKETLEILSDNGILSVTFEFNKQFEAEEAESSGRPDQKAGSPPPSHRGASVESPVFKEGKVVTHSGKEYYEVELDRQALLDYSVMSEKPTDATHKKKKKKDEEDDFSWVEKLTLWGLGVNLGSGARPGSGAMVEAVLPASDAETMGIQKGWRLAFIGDLKINRTADVALMFRDMQRVIDRQRVIDLKPSKKPLKKADFPLLTQAFPQGFQRKVVSSKVGFPALAAHDLPTTIALKFGEEGQERQVWYFMDNDFRGNKMQWAIPSKDRRRSYEAYMEKFAKQKNEAREQLRKATPSQTRLRTIEDDIANIRKMIASVTLEKKGTWHDRRLPESDDKLKAARSKLEHLEFMMIYKQKLDEAMDDGSAEALRVWLLNNKDRWQEDDLKPYLLVLENRDRKEAVEHGEGVIIVVKHAKGRDHCGHCGWPALGVTVKPSGDAFEVVGIDDGGVVAAYNGKSANKMLVTDLITVVNFRRELKDDKPGRAGALTRQDKMTQLLEGSESVIISFKPNPRAKEFSITMSGKQQRSTDTWQSWLGIETERRRGGRAISITRIQEGAIKRHSQKAGASGRASEVVRQGDRIVAVNGDRQVSEMLSVLGSVGFGDVTLVIIQSQEWAARESRKFEITMPALPKKWPEMLIKDSPGLYVVLRYGADVKKSMIEAKREPVLARLEEGQDIEVLEVQEFKGSGLVRGRIESPVQGWLTLLMYDSHKRLAKPQSEGAYLFSNASKDPWVWVEDKMKPRRKQAKSRIVKLVETGKWMDDKKNKKDQEQVEEMSKALAQCDSLGVSDEEILAEQDETLTLAVIKDLLTKEKQRHARKRVADLVERWNKKRVKKDQDVDDLATALRECAELDVTGSDISRAKTLLDEKDSLGSAATPVKSTERRSSSPDVEETHGVGVVPPELSKELLKREREAREEALDAQKALEQVPRETRKFTELQQTLAAAMDKLQGAEQKLTEFVTSYGGDFMVTVTRRGKAAGLGALGFNIDVKRGVGCYTIKDISEATEGGEPIFSIHAYNTEPGRKNEVKVMEGDIIVAVGDSQGVYHRWGAGGSDPGRERERMYTALETSPEVTVVFKRSKDFDFMVTATRREGVDSWKALGVDISASAEEMTIKEIFEDIDRNGHPIYSIHAYNSEGMRKKEDTKVMKDDVIVAVGHSPGVYLRWDAGASYGGSDPKRERDRIYKALQRERSVSIFFRRSKDRWSPEERAAEERSRPPSTAQDLGGDFMVIVPAPTISYRLGNLGADINEETGEISKIEKDKRLPIYSWNKASGTRTQEKVMEGDLIVAVSNGIMPFHKWHDSDTERKQCLEVIHAQYSKKVIVIKHPRDWRRMRVEKYGQLAKEGVKARREKLKARLQNFKFKGFLERRRGRGEKPDRQEDAVSLSPSFSSSSLGGSSSLDEEGSGGEDGEVLAGLFRRVENAVPHVEYP